jgi:hypothetical protein
MKQSDPKFIETTSLFKKVEGVHKPPSGLELLRLSQSIKKRKFYNRSCDMEKYIRSEKWDWFITITSKHHLTLASARRVGEIFISLIKCSSSEGFLQGSENHKTDVTKGNDGLALWVAEPHKHSSAGYHLHILMRLPYRYKDLTNRQQFRILLEKSRLAVGGNRWENQKGIIGLWHRIRLEPYKGYKAAEYCAKYVTKQFTDYDFTRVK